MVHLSESVTTLDTNDYLAVSFIGQFDHINHHLLCQSLGSVDKRAGCHQALFSSH